MQTDSFSRSCTECAIPFSLRSGIIGEQQKFTRVRAIEKCCFAASGIISIAAVFVIALLPEPITKLFVPEAGIDVLTLSVGALQLFSLTYITRWISFATQSYMLAIEKPLPASIISVSTALIFPVILICALWPLGLTLVSG